MTSKVISSELGKLRRPSITLWLLIGALAMTSVATVLAITGIGGTSTPVGPGSGTLTVADFEASGGVVAGYGQAAQLLGLIALGLAGWSFAGEFSQGTIRNILVRQPSRIRFVAGKWAALCLFLAGVAVAAWLLSVVLSFIVAPGQGLDTSSWTTTDGAGAAFEGLGLMAVALIGYGTLGSVLGLLLRSPVTAVAIGTIYLLPFESLLSGSWDGGESWLPGQLLSAVASDGVSGVTASEAGWKFFLFALALSAITTWSFQHRDVSV